MTSSPSKSAKKRKNAAIPSSTQKKAKVIQRDGSFNLEKNANDVFSDDDYISGDETSSKFRRNYQDSDDESEENTPSKKLTIKKAASPKPQSQPKQQKQKEKQKEKEKEKEKEAEIERPETVSVTVNPTFLNSNSLRKPCCPTNMLLRMLMI